MEEEVERIVDNAPGKYYVSSECNNCGICSLFGNNNFMFSRDRSYFYVMQQPIDNHEEISMCLAMLACPQKCIKDDGRHWDE
jgi:ferredoxin